MTMFESTKGEDLVPPALVNYSCWASDKNWLTTFPEWENILKATFILFLTLGTFFGNIILAFLLCSCKRLPNIDNQPRYLFVSLALNDLLSGIFITGTAILPALFDCWPYGEIFCQIQAVMRGALAHQSVVILTCMALDRYIYKVHPNLYHRYASKTFCVVLLAVTWILSIAFYARVIHYESNYYYDSSGLMGCCIFYRKSAFKILSCSTYYFPATMCMMYFYGTAFHVKHLHRKRNARPIGPPLPAPELPNNDHAESYVRPYTVSTYSTMAGMSFAFICLQTPLTIVEIVVACTGCKIPLIVNFILNWTALSSSFWNPFIYWLINKDFRRIFSDYMNFIFCCRKPKLSNNGVSTICCLSSDSSDGFESKGDFEGQGEELWSEILERTVSNNSLHAMQCQRDPFPYPTSFKEYQGKTCTKGLQFYEDDESMECAHFERPAYQIESCSRPLSRPCALRNSEFYLNGPGTEMECHRSNLSLDEGRFNKVCQGRHPNP